TLLLHVGHRCGIVADAHQGDAGPAPRDRRELGPELGDQRGGDPVAIDDLHLLQAEADDVYHKVVGILDGSDRAQYDDGVAGVVRDLLGEQEPGDVDV